jgi:hypothetical protein
MEDENKHNLHYFEGSSMRELYDSMKAWQDTNQKRLLLVSIQQDEGKFCCIALTNPSEVVIVGTDGYNPGYKQAMVQGGRLAADREQY